MKKKLKTINIHQDYVLSCMVHTTRSAIQNLNSYMQAMTPYGDEYIKAFNEYKKILKAFDKYEDALQDTVEKRTGGLKVVND